MTRPGIEPRSPGPLAITLWVDASSYDRNSAVFTSVVYLTPESSSFSTLVEDFLGILFTYALSAPWSTKLMKEFIYFSLCGSWKTSPQECSIYGRSIYNVFHWQPVLSQRFNVARHAWCLKMGSKPSWFHVCRISYPSDIIILSVSGGIFSCNFLHIRYQFPGMLNSWEGLLL